MTTLWNCDKNCDPIYEHYRDSSHVHPTMVRDELQRWWDKAEPYLDKNFPELLCQQPYPRFWELRLATLLLENGKHIVPVQKRGTRGAGPDFLIEDNNGRTWVEAVALTCGDEKNPDRVPDIDPTDRIVCRELPGDQIELRIASVISDKIKKFNHYFENNVVGKDDRTIIAVNTGNVQYREREDRGTPFCVVYPVSNLQYAFGKFDEGGRTSYQERSQIEKTGGAAVGTGYFSNAENENITGVLWSTFSVSNYPFPSGDYCYFPNPCAVNPLETKWMDWTYEWIYEVTGDEAKIDKVNYKTSEFILD